MDMIRGLEAQVALCAWVVGVKHTILYNTLHGQGTKGLGIFHTQEAAGIGL